MSAAVKAIAELAGVRGPLAGTLVLEICGEEPSGSLGTQILADLGATVFKIERPPEKDVPAFEPPAEGKLLRRDVAFFCGLNRNKRSICLDLKHDKGRAIFHSLARVADVVYDNYRPGVTARLGADYATLSALNPGIICCSVTGFGHTGPWSHLPGYDATILALGGGMSITSSGRPGSPPVRWGNPIGGIGGALYAVVGILAALRWRRVGRRGGAWLDISMFDTQLAMHAYRVPPALDGKVYLPEPRRGGIGSVPYGPFKCGDGRWFVVGVTSQFWEAACRVLGHPEWIDDPRFATQEQRQANEDLVNSLVAEAMLTRSSDEWQELFVGAQIPAGKVTVISEAFRHPHVALRDMLVGFKDGTFGDRVKVAGNPIKMSGYPFEGVESPPGFGEHTALVLKSVLNLPEEECARLRAERVAWWPLQGKVYERPSVV